MAKVFCSDCFRICVCTSGSTCYDWFAECIQKTGVQVVGTPATLANAEALVTAINVGQGELDGKAPTVGRILFVEAKQYRAVELLDTTKSRETLQGSPKSSQYQR